MIVPDTAITCVVGTKPRLPWEQRCSVGLTVLIQTPPVSSVYDSHPFLKVFTDNTQGLHFHPEIWSSPSVAAQWDTEHALRPALSSDGNRSCSLMALVLVLPIGLCRQQPLFHIYGRGAAPAHLRQPPAHSCCCSALTLCTASFTLPCAFGTCSPCRHGAALSGGASANKFWGSLVGVGAEIPTQRA